MVLHMCACSGEARADSKHQALITQPASMMRHQPQAYSQAMYRAHVEVSTALGKVSLNAFIT